MDTWTLQMGYPVITIKRDRDNAGVAVATQKHFLISDRTKPEKSVFG